MRTSLFSICDINIVDDAPVVNVVKGRLPDIVKMYSRSLHAGSASMDPSIHGCLVQRLLRRGGSNY